MDSELEILSLEGDIAFEQCDIDINTIIASSIFTEASDDKSVLQKIIERIKKLISDIKNKISDFFSKKKTKDLIDNTEKAMKSNPKVKNQKIKVPNFDKLNKLFEKTKSAVIKNPNNADEILEKSSKLQKALLATGAGVAVTVGAAFAWFKKIDKTVDVSWTYTDLKSGAGEIADRKNQQELAIKQAKSIEKLLKFKWIISKSYLEQCSRALLSLGHRYALNDENVNKLDQKQSEYATRSFHADMIKDKLRDRYDFEKDANRAGLDSSGILHTDKDVARAKANADAAEKIANGYKKMYNAMSTKKDIAYDKSRDEFENIVSSKKK